MSNVNLFFKLSLMLLLIASANACNKSKSSTTSSGVLQLAEINYFKESVPTKFCGADGYGYLYRNYFKTSCGECHNASGWFPAFVDDNLEKSFSMAKVMDRDTLIFRSTQNPRCTTNCNLDNRGEVYQALVQWLDNRESDCK